MKHARMKCVFSLQFFLDVLQTASSNYDEDFQTSRLVLMFSSSSLRTQGAPAAEGMILGAELHL